MTPVWADQQRFSSTTMAETELSVSVHADTTDAVESIDRVTEAVRELDAALDDLNSDHGITLNIPVDADRL